MQKLLIFLLFATAVYLFVTFSAIFLPILAGLIIVFIIMRIIKQKKLQEKIVIEYQRYLRAMKGKDKVKSYEEYKQSYSNNIIQKERGGSKFQVDIIKEYLKYCESTKVEDSIKSYEEFSQRVYEDAFRKYFDKPTYEDALNVYHASSSKYNQKSTYPIEYSEYQKMLEEQLFIEYQEYCESTNVKNNIKSYEEFNQQKYEEAKKIAISEQEPTSKRILTNERASAKYVPKCPTCSSANITRIHVGIKIFFLGPFAPLYKTFKCNNCGYKW